MSSSQRELELTPVPADQEFAYGMAISQFVKDERLTNVGKTPTLYSQIYNKDHMSGEIDASIREIIKFGYCWIVNGKGNVWNDIVAIGVFIPPSQSKRVFEKGNVKWEEKQSQRFDPLLNLQKHMEEGLLKSDPEYFERGHGRFWRTKFLIAKAGQEEQLNRIIDALVQSKVTVPEQAEPILGTWFPIEAFTASEEETKWFEDHRFGFTAHAPEVPTIFGPIGTFYVRHVWSVPKGHLRLGEGETK